MLPGLKKSKIKIKDTTRIAIVRKEKRRVKEKKDAECVCSAC